MDDATQEARHKEMLDQILVMVKEMASDLEACKAAFGATPPAFVADSRSTPTAVPAASLTLSTPSPTSTPPHDTNLHLVASIEREIPNHLHRANQIDFSGHDDLLSTVSTSGGAPGNSDLFTAWEHLLAESLPFARPDSTSASPTTSAPSQDADLGFPMGAAELLVTSHTKCSMPGHYQGAPVAASANNSATHSELSYIHHTLPDPPVSDEDDLYILFDADGGGVDRLSRLPDTLLRDIVARLPIKDAASTAVLSRRLNSISGTSATLHVGHLGLRFHGIEGPVPSELFDRPLAATTNDRTGWIGSLIGDLCAARGIPFAHDADRLKDRASLKADDASKSIADHDPSAYTAARAWRPPWLSASLPTLSRRRCSPSRDPASSYIVESALAPTPASVLEFLIRPYDPGAEFDGGARVGVYFDSEIAAATHANCSTVGRDQGDPALAPTTQAMSSPALTPPVDSYLAIPTTTNSEDSKHEVTNSTSKLAVVERYANMLENDVVRTDDPGVPAWLLMLEVELAKVPLQQAIFHRGSIGEAAAYIYTSKGNGKGRRRTRTTNRRLQA